MLITHPDLYFTLDGVPSQTPAWNMINTLELYKPAKRRGTRPVVLPGASGARAMPLRADATERTINGKVFGGWDPDGVPMASEIEGILENLATLRTSWAAIPAGADSTRTCVLHAYGAVFSGPVQVLDFDWDSADMPICANVIMRLLLPAGELVELAST